MCFHPLSVFCVCDSGLWTWSYWRYALGVDNCVINCNMCHIQGAWYAVCCLCPVVFIEAPIFSIQEIC